MVAIFVNFQNGLIFRILFVFSSRFLHRTTAMGLKSRFWHFLCNFNFCPKLIILERPLHGGHFCQFSKWPFCLNINCFFAPFFA